MTPKTLLGVIIVAHNSADCLAPCLSSVFAKSGGIDMDVVVVDSGSTDDTVDRVRQEFPKIRVLTTENRGFASANNRGLEVVDAEWVLFLNPDTRILSGTLATLVSTARVHASVGLAGVRQLDENGVLDPTMRRFPSVVRSLSASLGGERLPFHASWLGERVLELDLYGQETRCDWTVGSFMLVRRAALDDVGGMDERFFLYSEEIDFCQRIQQAGWTVLHLPQMTILHESSTTASDPRLNAQMAFARRQYMAKHFSLANRTAGIATLGLGYALRSVRPGRGPDAGRRRSASRSALTTLLGLTPPPFGYPSASDETTVTDDDGPPTA